LEDIIEGLVSEQAAQAVYGVVLRENKQAVDLAATKSLRTTRSKS
jgi:hypothetical protein